LIFESLAAHRLYVWTGNRGLQIIHGCEEARISSGKDRDKRFEVRLVSRADRKKALRHPQMGRTVEPASSRQSEMGGELQSPGVSCRPDNQSPDLNAQ
jgi:hypothetical protein